MKIRRIVEWINEQAPFDSAEEFDNVGLLLGDMNADVSTVLVGMDVTEALVRQAVAIGAQLIITHHPFIFHALKRIDYSGPQGRAMCLLMQHRIAVIAAHTNWDKASGGVSDSLALALELQNIRRVDDYLRVGTLLSPKTADELDEAIVEALGSQTRVYGDSIKPISKVAVAGGAYGEGYALACEIGADAFVVGEVAHHEILDACERGLMVYDAGHYATEMPGVVALHARLADAAQEYGWPLSVRLYADDPYAGAIL